MSTESARKEANRLGSIQQVTRQTVKSQRRKRTTTAATRRNSKSLNVAMGAGESTIPDKHVATPCTAKEDLRCRTCSSVLHQVQDTENQSSPVVQCLTCPGKPFICGTCLSPWQGRPGDAKSHCPNNRCAMVGTLLTCGLITDPNSKVKGCPEFRACPKCYSLIMHGCGCKYVTCSQCGHRFCYICLSDRTECNKESEYWSLTCSKPTPGRQWFCA